MSLAEIARHYLREEISLAAPLLVWLLNRFYRDRAQLVQSVKHSFTYLIEEPLKDDQGNIIKPKQTVQVASMSVLNSGREVATNVEVVFNWEPVYINTWPPRHYEKKKSADGRCSYFFDSLPPKDVVGFELMAINAEIPGAVSVRSDQSVAKIIPLTPQPTIKRWKMWTMAWLLLSGIAINTYFFASLVQILGTK